KGKNYLHLPELMNPEQIPILKKRLISHQKGEKIKPIEIEVIKKDGSSALIRPNLSLLTIDDKPLGMAIFEDITEMENAKQKLQTSEENYRKAYEQADFYKDIFTHDMLNILNNIKGSFQVYKFYKNQENKSEKIDEMMNIINEQVINGIKLIYNIRQLSRLEEKPDEFLKIVNVCEVLKNAIDFIYKSYEKKKVIIYGNFPDKNLTIKANDLLVGVFENILINSIKYNKNTPVKIYISMLKERKNDIDHIKIDIIDNGIGISDALKQIIFKEGHKKEKRSKGMGFGLTLVKKLIDAYGGEIWVEDKIKGDPSQGTKFSIMIPESK
ncbi:MAG: ATP-binding protein, partial [Promethearchaeota archaeon]